MSDIVYRFRIGIALAGALAVSTIAFAAFPTIGDSLRHIAGAAAMPGCGGTQNPFIGS